MSSVASAHARAANSCECLQCGVFGRAIVDKSTRFLGSWPNSQGRVSVCGVFSLSVVLCGAEVFTTGHARIERLSRRGYWHSSGMASLSWSWLVPAAMSHSSGTPLG